MCKRTFAAFDWRSPWETPPRPGCSRTARRSMQRCAVRRCRPRSHSSRHPREYRAALWRPRRTRTQVQTPSSTCCTGQPGPVPLHHARTLPEAGQWPRHMRRCPQGFWVWAVVQARTGARGRGWRRRRHHHAGSAVCPWRRPRLQSTRMRRRSTAARYTLQCQTAGYKMEEGNTRTEVTTVQ